MDNIVLKRDNGVITLKSDVIGFTPKTMGRDAAAVFSGEGEFLFHPISLIEKNRLASITGGKGDQLARLPSMLRSLFNRNGDSRLSESPARIYRQGRRP